jgi:hypothetical protein
MFSGYRAPHHQKARFLERSLRILALDRIGHEPRLCKRAERGGDGAGEFGRDPRLAVDLSEHRDAGHERDRREPGDARDHWR